MSNARRPRSVSEALKRRKTRTSRYRIPLEEHVEMMRRAKLVEEARNTIAAGIYLQNQRPDDPSIVDAVDKAKQELGVAQKALDACFHDIVFEGIPEREFDKLVQAFPPPADQVEKAKEAGEEMPMWDEQEFPLALLERCTLESDLSMEQWREELATWSHAERQEIVARVLDCNLRSFSHNVDFG
jgi:hypothetical protein